MFWAFFGTIVLVWFLALIVFGFGTVIHAMMGLWRASDSCAAAVPVDQWLLKHKPSTDRPDSRRWE
jgi:hypothetical protein